MFKFGEISSTMLLSEKWDRKYVGYKDVFIFMAEKQKFGRGQH